MLDVKIEWGRNVDGVFLVHLNVQGVVSAAYPGSFTYADGRVGWRDRLGVDPDVTLPARVKKYVTNEPSAIICVLSEYWNGYAELKIERGQQESASWQKR